jgi:hypothetical protein
LGFLSFFDEKKLLSGYKQTNETLGVPSAVRDSAPAALHRIWLKVFRKGNEKVKHYLFWCYSLYFAPFGLYRV